MNGTRIDEQVHRFMLDTRHPDNIKWNSALNDSLSIVFSSSFLFDVTLLVVTQKEASNNHTQDEKTVKKVQQL